MAPGSSPLRRPFFSNLDFTWGVAFFFFSLFSFCIPFRHFYSALFLPFQVIVLFSLSLSVGEGYSVDDTLRRIQNDAIFFPLSLLSFVRSFVNRIDVFIERIVMVRSKITMIGIHRANWTIGWSDFFPFLFYFSFLYLEGSASARLFFVFGEWYRSIGVTTVALR